MIRRLKALTRGDGGWFWITSLILIPAAFVALFVGGFCIYLAFKI